MERPTSTAQKLSLLSLTTELILLVLDNCLTRDVYALSQTSRRLHYLAIPLYFSRFGIRDGFEAREIHLKGRYTQALRGLQSSLILPSLERLSIKFNNEASFALELCRLVAFVSRSERIREVTLHFGNIDSRWANGLIAVNAVNWRSDLLKLLSMLVERQCETLNVRQGYFLTYETVVTAEQHAALVPEHRAFLDRQISAVSNLFHVSSAAITKERVVRNCNSMSVEWPDRPLRTFRLHSNLFFTHPFYSWMMEMFRKTPITSLSLQVPGVMGEEWACFFRSLTIPTLRHVAFISPIPFENLLIFISRHPYLTSVDLHPHFLYSFGKRLPKKWKLSLPSLGSLGGSPANVKLFLSHSLPFPALRHFSISLPVHQRPFGRADFEMVDKMILTALKDHHPHTLTLGFIVPAVWDDLPGDASNSGNSDSPATAAFAKYTRASLFPTVKTVRFSSDGSFAFSQWTLPLLPQWLATFTALKQVSFATNCLPQDAADRERTVKAIKEACPGVGDVLLDDNSYVHKFAYWR